ncbi:MAG: Gfo/Idh/MocA family protein, partial [Nitrospinaceae bacterium]
KKLVQRGKIGELRTIVGNALSLPPGKHSVAAAGGGPLFHDGTHLTDLFLFFGGPVAWVSGWDRRTHGRGNIEETAAAMLQFKSGALGFLEGGGARNYFNFELDLQGSKGRILIGNAGRELHLTRRSRRFSGFQELEPAPFPSPRRHESPFTGAARDLVACVRRGTPSQSGGEDGRRALKLILAVYASARQNGKRVRL